ncbi:MAG: aromatic ring-hydroxylating dioxygenase subunit alpha, partial [Planctomycetota bacterium]
MSERRLVVDPDVRAAETPPAWFYRDPQAYAEQREAVLARSWQLVLDADQVPAPRGAAPASFLPGSLAEPLAIT